MSEAQARSLLRVLGDGVDCCCVAETAFVPLNISIFLEFK